MARRTRIAAKVRRPFCILHSAFFSDCRRKDQRTGHDDWFNPNDPDAKITQRKDGRTHLAYQPAHALDLQTGVILAAEIHSAEPGDTTTLWGPLAQAADALHEVRHDEPGVEPCQANGATDPSALQIKEGVQDQGDPSAPTLVNLEELDLRGYVAVSSCPGRPRGSAATGVSGFGWGA